MKHGLLIKPRQTDYVRGVNSPLTLKSVNSGDWTPYFLFNEHQRNPQFDDDGCACYDANKVLDAWVNFLIATQVIPSSVVSQFTSLGFMDTGIDGQPHFHTSPRFTENMTGNGMNGNSIPECFDVIRKYGAVPWTLLPFDMAMTPAEYFSPIPQTVMDMGVQFLNLMGGSNFLQYHWVFDGTPKDISAMQQAITESPLSIGIAVDDAGWNQPFPVDPPADQAPQHAVSVPKINGNVVQISDNYIPFTKYLDAGYPINYCLQTQVQFLGQVEQQIVNTVSEIVPEVAQAPIPNPAKETLLQEIADALEKFLATL